MEIKTLVIDRARWGMGALLTEDGEAMCCLGFLAMACGATEAAIKGEGDPEGTPDIDWPSAFIRLARDEDDDPHAYPRNSTVTNDAIEINDSTKLPWEEKESRLIELFFRAGIQLSFVGERQAA